MRRRGRACTGFRPIAWLAGPTAAATIGAFASASAVTLEYPPNEVFGIGSVSAVAHTNTVSPTTYSCGFDQSFFNTFTGVTTVPGIASSQFSGTGGPFAQISFSIPFSYEAYNFTSLGSGLLLYATFGTNADLDFSSPSGGTIRFDTVVQVDPGGLDQLGLGFPFTVETAAAAGSYTFTYTIRFPNCALTIEGPLPERARRACVSPSSIWRRFSGSAGIAISDARCRLLCGR